MTRAIVNPLLRAKPPAHCTRSGDADLDLLGPGFLVLGQMHLEHTVFEVGGDFGGAGVIRRVGTYLSEHGAVVRTFYGSNVPVYLTVQQNRVYCGYLASLPAARGASYVDNDSVRPLRAKLEDCARSR